MDYLLETYEFDFKSKIELIKARIINSGYISVSMSQDLDEITGFPGFSDYLIYKSYKIVKLFEGCNSEWMNDILFEYFEDYYNLKFDWGLWDGNRSGSVGWNRYSSTSKVIGNLDSIVDPNLSTEDRVRNVMVSIIDFLYEKTSDSWKEYNKNRDDYYASKRSDRTKLGDFYGTFKKSKPSIQFVKNYFKFVMTVQPSVICHIEHRDIDLYWDEMDNGYKITNGIRYKDQYSLTGKITKRLNHFKVKFGNFYPSSTEFNNLRSLYTDDVNYFSENKLLLKSSMSINFTD